MRILNKDNQIYEDDVLEISSVSDENVSFTELIPIHAVVFIGITTKGKRVRTTVYLHWPDDFDENDKPIIKPELFYKKVWSEFEDE